MKKFTKRFFALLLSVLMFASLILFDALAVGETDERQPETEQERTLTAVIYEDGSYTQLSQDESIITISGLLPEGAEALAYPINPGEESLLCAYDIAIRLQDGSLFEPGEDAPATISIQSPAFSEMDEGMEMEVYLISGQGEAERVESLSTGSEVSFRAGCLGAYMVVAAPADQNPDEPAAIALSNDFLYENDQFSIVLHVEGDAYLQDGTLEGTSEPASDEPTEKEIPVLVVVELDEQHTEYQQIVSALNEVYADGLLELSVLSIELYYRDALLDVSSCSITAQITPQPQMMETARAACAEMEENGDPAAEMGVVFTVVEATADGTEVLDSAMVEKSTQEAPVLTVSVSGKGILAVAAGQTANPKFTVQYFAWLDIVADSGNADDSLPVIDTSGRNLPQNGTVDPATKTLYLEETASGSGIYGIKTTSTLSRVYRDHAYEYITAPNLAYFNRLYENGNYELKEIWILKAGMDPNSMNVADWDVYDPATTHFTNRSESQNENTVLITEGTVIRLVFDTTESPYTSAVNFYDYDITDDGIHTEARGINKNSNYSGTGTHLAFGNDNTGTGLGGLDWNGNQLNKYNNNGYSGCTFGLVTGLSGGKIQYASGVAAPNLFDDGAATGKTSYDNGQYTLSFDRNGDTYTLAAVNGTGANNLQYFNHPTCGDKIHTHIWTNNFWPMDVVKNTDPHTGKDGDTGTYTGASEKTQKYPPSDDGLAHNSMFGMTYKVNFELTEDYIGPLEYYFFGDDDMWVFLDDQLVCDIGGVHSSVGEYVNLWDYITQGSAGTHTLTFYYTERGLSGSTCYMQFTLPSVSSITPEQNTSLLKVEKQVLGGADSEQEFHFEIKFTDENGNPLPDDYSYTRYAANGTVLMQDIIIFDGGSFDLKAGEYVIINYLPYGTKYTITETNAGSYIVTNKVDGNDPIYGNAAEGQIPTGQNGYVVFTNIMPPHTGGPGTILYAIAGVMMMASALFLLNKYIKRREWLNS